MTKDGRRATIVDVGRVAGVSTKTVSRVFNDEAHVSAAVRQRVREAAATLNYHPNLLAQALVRRRSHLLGLIYEKPSPSYVVELQQGVLEALQNTPYRLIVIPVLSVSERAEEAVGLVRSAALDGVILAPPASDNPIILAGLDAAKIACGRIAPTRLLDAGPYTLVDDVAGAREIAAHVLSLGHRDIAIIKGDPTHPSVDARLIGYQQAFHAAGVPLRIDRIEPGAYTRESGQAAGERLLAGSARPTAVLAMNDDMAVGVALAARAHGLSLPEDLSIAGYDDSEVSRIAWPRITTVRQPVTDMAATATEMVLAQLGGRPVRQRVDLPHRLLIRESTKIGRAHV